MKSRGTVLAILVLLQVALLLTGAIPEWLSSFQKYVPNWAMVIVYSQVMLLGLYVAFSDSWSKLELSDCVADWTRTLAGVNRVDVLHEDEFYADFENKIASAQHNVDICHFGKLPPTKRPSSPEEDYYDRFHKAVKNSPAAFRRLERITPEKIEWIERLIKGFKGVKNFSLACLHDEDTESDQILPVSVQRIDQTKVYLVALGEHYSTTGHRDIFINSKEVADLIGRYFEGRLWRRSIRIIDRGAFDEQAWSDLRGRVLQSRSKVS